ncbi:MAG: DUF2997 domain-containing protein [Synechococcus sp. MED-G71]|nr:MAG: DUF2997 domain-containing protein [Synechococcus sp. MED-G71]
MPQQSIRFRIRPDGRVEELVEGVQGAGCQDLTRSIEARLGTVSSVQPTADHFQQASASQSVQQGNHVALQHGQN